MQKKVYFGGGRHCTSSALINQVVTAVLARGAVISVGCAIGADQSVIHSVMSQGASSSLTIQAAFSPSGAGAWRGSAVQVIQSASKSKAHVSWLAGGGLSVSLPARLMRRSIAGLRGSSAALFFQPGTGSFKVMGQAVTQNIPVYVFGSRPASCPHGFHGSWLQVRLCGIVY